ncbi:hypothetical protein ABFS82_11G083900 [Erythranthe guttata]
MHEISNEVRFFFKLCILLTLTIGRANFLVGVAPGTERVNTAKSIDVNTREYPPVKVMQTAVIGTGGSISYRLNLEDFPANARAYAYFAEIEDLRTNDTRKFKMELPYMPDYSNAVVNIAENANGSYTLYEPSYMNVSLDFVLTFEFKKTRDSTRGPLLNAMEISRYVEIAAKTDEKDVRGLDALLAMSEQSEWVEEGGDPCSPTNWEWLTCSATSPPRITKIFLSGKNVRAKYRERWLDGNSFIGTIPNMSDLVNLKILFAPFLLLISWHLENNQLTGSLPSYLGKLPYLQELYVQNNSLSGEIPSSLLRGNLTFSYEGNPHLKDLNKQRKNVTESRTTLRRNEKGNSWRASTRPLSGYSIARDEGVAYYIPLSDLEEATNNFSKKIGKGSFGPVYYGKLMDGKEVAVKTMADSSSHGTKQLITEVALLSRIHHRNLVPLIGYCEEEHQRMLVYEYMHNGTLRDHINDSENQKHLDWQARLEYLHTGCNPSIINRDVKTSNILLDINMRAKVSDFGLSRQAEEDLTHVSSVTQGTVGYLDPEYYPNKQLTEKKEYGSDWSIAHWARALIRKRRRNQHNGPHVNRNNESRIGLENSGSSDPILLYGGPVISWTNNNGEELLFLRERANYTNGIRGGISIYYYKNGDLEEHGIARTFTWRIDDLTNEPNLRHTGLELDEAAFVDLVIDSNQEDIQNWPYGYVLLWDPSEIWI